MARHVTTSLSADDARVIAVRAQGLGSADRPRTPSAVLQRVGAVQLDTISVLARSHELVAYSRLGPVPRQQIEAAYWSQPARAFEYVAHANCIIPIEDWPYFTFRRRQLGGGVWPQLVGSPAVAEVQAALRDGPITVTDVGGARETSGWWNWSAAKRALDLMFARGDVVCTMRRNWKRVYDLPERAIPTSLRLQEPSAEASYIYLVRKAAQALGVGTRRDIANYYMLLTSYVGRGLDRKRLFDGAMDASGLIEVQVEGWDEPAYAFESTLKQRRASSSRTTLLSPFDSLIWAEPRIGKGPLRARALRLFGYDMLFEPYVPKEKRVHGYFTMPLLANNHLVGHIDPAREGKTLVARGASLQDTIHLDSMADALCEAAAWVGCDRVRVDTIKPRKLTSPIRGEIARRGFA